MAWLIYVQGDEIELCFLVDTLQEAKDIACDFINNGLEVVKLESDLGFTIEGHIVRDLCL